MMLYESECCIIIKLLISKLSLIKIIDRCVAKLGRINEGLIILEKILETSIKR